MFELTSFRLPAKPVTALRKADTFFGTISDIQVSPTANDLLLAIKSGVYVMMAGSHHGILWYCRAELLWDDVSVSGSTSLFPPLIYTGCTLTVPYSSFLHFQFWFFFLVFPLSWKDGLSLTIFTAVSCQLCSNFYFASASSSPETASPKQTELSLTHCLVGAFACELSLSCCWVVWEVSDRLGVLPVISRQQQGGRLDSRLTSCSPAGMNASDSVVLLREAMISCWM